MIPYNFFSSTVVHHVFMSSDGDNFTFYPLPAHTFFHCHSVNKNDPHSVQCAQKVTACKEQ